MSPCGRFAERKIDRKDILAVISKMLGIDPDKHLTQDQTIAFLTKASRNWDKVTDFLSTI